MVDLGRSNLESGHARSQKRLHALDAERGAQEIDFSSITECLKLQVKRRRSFKGPESIVKRHRTTRQLHEPATRMNNLVGDHVLELGAIGPRFRGGRNEVGGAVKISTVGGANLGNDVGVTHG